MAESKWKPLGGTGEFHKWTEAGEKLEGIWEGTYDGQYGPVGTLRQPDGSKVRFAMNTVLVDRLKRVKEGAELLIEYLGKQTSKKGREFKAFQVYVAGDDALLPPEEASGDEPPF